MRSRWGRYHSGKEERGSPCSESGPSGVQLDTASIGRREVVRGQITRCALNVLLRLGPYLVDEGGTVRFVVEVGVGGSERDLALDPLWSGSGAREVRAPRSGQR